MMDQLQNFISNFAKGTNSSSKGVHSAVKLLQGGATVPFISRYRKEETGGLDEEQIFLLEEELERFTKLEERRSFILEALLKENVPGDLIQSVKKAATLEVLEDLYLPYKPKRVTKAQKARAAGLGEIADGILDGKDMGWKSDWKTFVSEAYPDLDSVLEGVEDIIAESLSEKSLYREIARDNFKQYAFLQAKPARGKQEEASNYSNYFEFKTPWKKVSSHQVLAIYRGQKEKLLSVKVDVERSFLVKSILYRESKWNNRYRGLKETCVQSMVDRFLAPAMDTEIKALLLENAETEAIRVFQKNLRNLLLSEPLGEKRVLALDPGFKSGCKLVVVDEHGNLLHNETIYPHPPQNDKEVAGRKIQNAVEAYKVDVIAVGDGTAGRETEAWLGKLRWKKDVKVFMVNEDGASVYSASPIGRKEFPDYDVTVRGSVSIGRRLQDPLAELVKIDPKSLGIGQYQHDVNKGRLAKSLENTVVSVVNQVGVDVNSSSVELLKFVSGLSRKTAENILEYRKEIQRFKNRKQLLKVPGIGPKAFDLCAGFLRVEGGDEPLDATSVHPEKYAWLKQQITKAGFALTPETIKDEALLKKLEDLVQSEADLNVKSAVEELKKVGRKKREFIPAFRFSDSLRSFEDLREGMELPGIIANVANFGAFVKLGIKENGLIHVSKLKKGFVSDPLEVVQLNQQVVVKVIQLDPDRKRIGLELMSS